ncbi:MAG TPA: NAD(P)-dependent oxidoreductase, partial [Conexibacter sp.]|nr:NAD(P)-dependent oxidoreductase [Conexibacter sp.]
MADPLQIVATQPIPELAVALLAPLGAVRVAGVEDDAAMAAADVLVVRTASVDETVLARAPRLRAIARTGAGLDTIDLPAATAAGVPVLYAPDAGVAPIAEGTIALILAATKRLGELHGLVADGRWDERYAYETRDLADTTLGIVGLGRIGSAVAQLAHGLGMQIVAFEPNDAAPGPEGVPVRRLPLDELFRTADVITLHCNLDERTRGLVDARLLASTKRGAALVNAGRGELIADEALLIEALDRGSLSAVGLDVFAQEPLDPGSPLVRDPRVTCTPHSIGLTRAWNERV